jgi:hypothetical protein
MIKTITTAQVRNICEDLLPNWETERKNIQVSGRDMYSIIKIKKELEKKLGEIQETVATLAEQSGGERQDNGSYKIPPEKIEDLNNELAAFSDEEVEIEYTPIKIKNDDVLPPVLMDCLFDFIDME